LSQELEWGLWRNWAHSFNESKPIS
jgi:hypothetical protein